MNCIAIEFTRPRDDFMDGSGPVVSSYADGVPLSQDVRSCSIRFPQPYWYDATAADIAEGCQARDSG
ncbi:hypothetical protein [Thalassoglobus neptunius]|uniref:hypothetical protein n=1 Tax=Thalassoglobus neptunius TaxID=1938619 RepID=UPI001E2D94DC|nr:hypothetical protein [Thalassoglobus neptunius]